MADLTGLVSPGGEGGRGTADTRPPDATAVARLLLAATARAEAAGELMTDGRRRVLELLLTAGKPLKAYDLIASFHVDGHIAKPASIYRPLEFLERLGAIHRIPSISAYVASSNEGEQVAVAFLICTRCRRCLEIAPPNYLIAAVSASGFTCDRVMVEVHGSCADCPDQ